MIERMRMINASALVASSWADGAFIAPEDGVYKAVYNGKLQYSREEKVISEDEEEVL